MEPLTLHAAKFFFDRMLPVRIFYTQCSEVADWHTHEFTEIAIILEGKANYETDFSTFPIKAGDVLVMPSGGIHRFSQEIGIKQFNILFQFEKLSIPSGNITKHPGFSALFRLNPEYCRKMRYYPHFSIKDTKDLDKINFILSLALEDQENKRIGYPLSVYGCFLQLIPILLENYQKTTPKNLNPRRPERLADVLDFMQHNFRKGLTTEQLADIAKMAPASFVRHFKAATGNTPLEYLIKMRLEETQIALLDKNLTIAEAAQQAGFEDSNYFSRLFKNKYSMSPKEYRKLNLSNIQEKN